MSQSLLTAFILFALVMCFTPGPNNIMLLSSAVTYGFRRTLPHIMGITIGFAFMVGAVGRGWAPCSSPILCSKASSNTPARPI